MVERYLVLHLNTSKLIEQYDSQSLVGASFNMNNYGLVHLRIVAGEHRIELHLTKNKGDILLPTINLSTSTDITLSIRSQQGEAVVIASFASYLSPVGIKNRIESLSSIFTSIINLNAEGAPPITKLHWRPAFTEISSSMSASTDMDPKDSIFQITTHPTRSFEDMGGYTEQIETLRGLALLINDRERAKRLAITIDPGILLHGPGGTGKTTAAEALAKELSCPFLTVSAAEVFNMWVGESEKAVDRIFMDAITHKKDFNVQVLVFLIDEIDSMLGSSDYVHRTETNVQNAFKSWLDGASRRQHEKELDGVVLVGTTNNIDSISETFTSRPGRFKVLEFGYPPHDDRLAIALKLIALRNRIAKEHGSVVDILSSAFATSIAASSDGLVGDHINSILQHASHLAFEKCASTVTADMIERATEFVRKNYPTNPVGTRRNRGRSVIGFN